MVKNYSPAGERDYENRRKMKTLKDKLKHDTRGGYFYLYDDEVEEAVLEFVNWKKSLLFDLEVEYDVYDEDEVNLYDMKKQHNERIKSDLEKIRQIFGDFEDEEEN